MKITRLRISNFLGVEHLDAAIPPDGAIATGSNAVGKTTVLKAIHAALAAQGIGPEAVRLGADRAEILLDMDAVTVRRAISANGNSLTVTTAEGDRWAKPQTRLTNLFGATLDPLAFYLANAADRRKLILAAMPVEVTADDLQRWTGEEWTPKAGMHGLEVVADVRKHYYDLRADANRAARDVEAKAKQAREAAEAMARPGHTDVLIPDEGQEDEMVRSAERERDSLLEQQRASEVQSRQTEGTRARIAKLRASAEAKLAESPVEVSEGELESLTAVCREADAEVERIEALLAEARKRCEDADAAWNVACNRNQSRLRCVAQAGEWAKQADELEGALASTAVAALEPTAIAAAAHAVESARNFAQLIKEARAAHLALERASEMEDEAASCRKEAEHLDAIVAALTTTAPTELASRSQLIPGLALAEDGITLDGRAIDNLSGAEQLRFAVDLAKRLSKAKILVVDGLERLDPVRMREFVAYATAGGWQLIGSRVTAGELVLEAIEPSRVTIEMADPESAHA